MPIRLRPTFRSPQKNASVPLPVLHGTNGPDIARHSVSVQAGLLCRSRSWDRPPFSQRIPARSLHGILFLSPVLPPHKLFAARLRAHSLLYIEPLPQKRFLPRTHASASLQKPFWDIRRIHCARMPCFRCAVQNREYRRR